MSPKKWIGSVVVMLISATAIAQKPDDFKPDFSAPEQLPGMVLSWHDEFNNNGRPDSSNWTYETGFKRNEEFQWYQRANANCSNGVLLIEGRREKIINPNYKPGSTNWRTSRQYAEYTSASINTQGLRQFSYGSFVTRARIDTAMGAWPAIWTLGANGEWPSNGEIDIMEFYRVKKTPTILANIAWGTDQQYVAKWNSKKIPLSYFIAKDSEWTKKFHTWRMDWSKDSINLFLDDELLNQSPLTETINADGSNAFTRTQYFLLNLALGGANGGDPAHTVFPVKYEVDYVRYYKVNSENEQ